MAYRVVYLDIFGFLIVKLEFHLQSHLYIYIFFIFSIYIFSIDLENKQNETYLQSLVFIAL